MSPHRAKVKNRSAAGKNRKRERLRPVRRPALYATRLLDWYDRHRRLLPWRALPHATIDPYRVWLSEIMLQQTTVAAVAPYFQKFIARWPTVQALAAAPLDEIMAMWAGLGYYRRARMLHACARKICAEYGGLFPQTTTALLNLPGFGPYTAAAVMAIAFDQPANVVDGNVERVMARIFAITTPLPAAKKDLSQAAARLLPADRHGDYAQALMDLGATICTPRSPKCLLCPWHDLCQAHKLGIAETLPRRLARAAKPVRRAMAFVLFNPQGEIFLRPRPAEGLLGGMLEVPSSPWITDGQPELAVARVYAPAKTSWQVMPGSVRHVFTHFTLEVTVAVGTLRPAKSRDAAPGQWIGLKRLDKVALPSVMHKIVRHALNSVK